MIQIESFNSGHFERGIEYKYFVPNKINDTWSWNTLEINQLLEKAAAKLGALNSFSHLVPNIDLFILLHVTKEAVCSSRIEGTRTNIDEALLPLEDVQPERRNDWEEVNNYISALNDAIKRLDELPICSRLIKMAHKRLLKNVRGKYKLPGEFRTSQNWIGGTSIADAKFIPPHNSLLPELMSDLEYFLNDVKMPALIKIAIAHYQFETIHPFLDGNGRIGRLLITLFLVKEKLLDLPLLYLSTYFEKNRNLYYDNLNNVRDKNDLIQWIKYFLVGIEQTATHSAETLSQILAFKSETETYIQHNYGRRSSLALTLFHSMLERPFTKVDEAAKICNVSYKAANDLVRKMQNDGYLVETTGHNRNRMYCFQKYLQIFDN